MLQERTLKADPPPHLHTNLLYQEARRFQREIRSSCTPSVAPNYGIHEHTRVLFSISWRNIDRVRLHDDGAVPSGRRVESCDRLVVREPVVPTDNAKTNDMSFIVEDLEAFGAVGSWEARYNVDFTESAHVTVSEDDVAALDEMLVSLRVIEPANDRPYGGDWGSDLLYHRRAALVGANSVGVEARHGLWNWGGVAWQRGPPFLA
ncbi:hypothetical protein SADUNF_Sadunf16G0105900 [Salix dunnii]|uniref:Uncharacterized protein n=1 Tax=Salix dunnii TaxID=1413687 RepID=A0A835J909_9ROSI|nr:hypothetical protein SADUNF_Sadunf16G0105900 [Salix dunnii]